MRILLSVHHALDENQGAPGLTLALGRAFEQLGHRVTHLSFADLPGWLPAQGKELFYPEFTAWHLARHSRGFDVIDATTGDSWLWASVQRRRRRERPLLVTRSHGLEHRYWEEAEREAVAAGSSPRRRTRMYHGGVRLREVAESLRRADECVFSNRDDRDYAAKWLGVSRDRSSVVLNGIPDGFLDLPLRQAGDGPVRIAHIGTYAERKGARYAAAALAQVLAARDDAKVTFLGTHVSLGRVHADFPEDLRERVDVTPEYRHDDLPHLLQDHHILLSASLAEGFSLALPEGMACGLAPVATAISGAREIVVDDSNGLLVPSRDAGATASALLRLAGDRPLLERLRARAHASAQSLSWPRVAGDSLRVYERGLARLS
jgi:glycosyltransferase involved in cell wall biosynthesis